MSETRKMLEMMQANGGAGAKAIKWFAWFLIILGGILTVTIIGAMAGIPMIIMGVFLIFTLKYMAKQMQAFKGAASEQAEIIEHQLQQARSQKSE